MDIICLRTLQAPCRLSPFGLSTTVHCATPPLTPVPSPALCIILCGQVVAAALDTDVRIVFVGPQVPERLAGMGAQYGRVAMRFVQVCMAMLLGGLAAEWLGSWAAGWLGG
mgnify:CR=1 FL=1